MPALAFPQRREIAKKSEIKNDTESDDRIFIMSIMSNRAVAGIPRISDHYASCRIPRQPGSACVSDPRSASRSNAIPPSRVLPRTQALQVELSRHRDSRADCHRNNLACIQGNVSFRSCPSFVRYDRFNARPISFYKFSFQKSIIKR
jgi:hypothetical protein